MMELEFGGKKVEPDIRRLHDMAEVICDRKWLAKAKDFELYYMYRDLCLSRADRDKLVEQGLRYDITIIPPNMMGCEYVKTAGHYHPEAPGTGVTYPELYEVIEGEALYLLQRRDMSDVVVINASTGDKVLVPPGYGHITINWSNKQLKMSNFVARGFSSIYEPIKEMAGGAYYYTTEGWIKNNRYKEVPALRRLEAPDSIKLRKLGLTRSGEMYPLLKKQGSLDYLVHPGDHPGIFEGLLEI